MEKPFEEFLPSGYNHAFDDAAPAIALAAAHSSATGDVVVFGARYRLKTGARVSLPDVKFRMAGTRFDVEDTAALVQTVFSGGAGGTLTGRIGLLWTGSRGALSGDVLFVGLGSKGSTSLSALCFYDCQDLIADAVQRFDTFAAGRFVFWCNSCKFGDVLAVNMNGTQTFDSGNAGSACVTAGNQFCVFGDVVSRWTFKPARYVSTVVYGDGTKASNRHCRYGNVINYAEPASSYSSALSIRAATDCSFGDVVNHGATIGLNIERYSSDAGFSVDRVSVGNVVSLDNDQSASLSCAVNIYGESSSCRIGKVSVGKVTGQNCGSYGFFGGNVDAVVMDRLVIEGAIRLYGVAGGFFSFPAAYRSVLVSPYIGPGAATNIPTNSF